MLGGSFPVVRIARCTTPHCGALVGGSSVGHVRPTEGHLAHPSARRGTREDGLAEGLVSLIARVGGCGSPCECGRTEGDTRVGRDCWVATLWV